MKITIFSGARGASASPSAATVRECSAGELLDDLAAVPSRECADAGAKLDSPALALAHWAPGAARKSARDLAPDASTEVLAFDLDEMSAAAIAAAIPRWRDVEGLVHGTWKHTRAAPRLRLLVALDQGVPLADERAFKSLYRAAAAYLGIKHDTNASSICNLYFLPQHKPANGPGPRVRLRGRPLSVEALRAAVPPAHADASEAQEPLAGAAGARPDRAELKAVAKRWAKRGTSRDTARALQAVIRSERYAGDGHVYRVTQVLAYTLAWALPDLDEPWFREVWLGPCWRTMWPGEDLDRIEIDWANAWRSAVERVREQRAEYAADRAAVTAAPSDALDAHAVERARAHGGRLICLHGNAYYVYDPRAGHYSAPVRASGVAVHARALLAGVPGFAATVPTDTGRPAAKSPTQLLLDYGRTITGVEYHARVADTASGGEDDDDPARIAIQAYRWRSIPARYHAICDELFRAMAGETWPRFEAWLSHFRALSAPLPALVLVGPKKCWKSKTPMHLAKFWGTPANSAAKVMTRFNGGLLRNPVVWSDETLACDDRGRPQPERYRSSISETEHEIEQKGLETVTLHGALRHVVSVNSLDKVFSREVEGDAVEATMERFLVVRVDKAAVDRFELRWAGSPELDDLRAGSTMLEHVAWIEREVAREREGRFGVETGGDSDALARAKFAHPMLSRVMQVATESVLAEASRSVSGQLERMPVRVLDGRLLFAPKVLAAVWPDATAVRGYRGSAPDPAEISRLLNGAGFRVEGPGGPAGFPLSWPRWAQWLRLTEMYSIEAVAAAIAALARSR